MKKLPPPNIAAISAALITFAVYLPSLSNEFVNWDDYSYVYGNPHIRKLDPEFFRWAFSTFYASNWHPLTWVSHALDYAFWGLNPLGHHLTSILLHSANTLMVFLVAEKILGVRGEVGLPQSRRQILLASFITALLFGLHPLHVESVAWVAERKDLLCALFFLLSIFRYTKYAEVPNALRSGEKRSPRFLSRGYLSSLLFFALALMSKPMAVSLPAVLLILDWHPYERISSLKAGLKMLAEKGPFILLGTVSTVLTLLAQTAGKAVMPSEALPLSMRMANGAYALFAYLGKMVLPVNLVALYSYPLTFPVLSGKYLLSMASVVVVTGVCIILAARQRLWLAVWTYYCATLLPVLGIVQVGSQSMADRYTYLPSLGPFLAAGVAASWLLAKTERLKVRKAVIKAAGALVCVVLFMAMSYATVKQIGVWKDSLALWNNVIESGPGQSYIAYSNRGKVLGKAGRPDDAVRDFTVAIGLNPLNPDGYYDRAVAYSDAGLFDKAMADFDRAASLAPGDASVYAGRGALLERIGMLDKAIADYTTAISLDPRDFRSYSGRGACWLQKGAAVKAIEDLTKAVSINPRDGDSFNIRGAAYEETGQAEKALSDYSTAIVLNPRNYGAFNNRGLLYMAGGRLDEALNDFTAAVRINPSYSLAYYNRGLAFYKKGMYTKSIGDFGKVTELDRGNATAFTNRGYAYLRMGEGSLAIADFQKGCALGDKSGCKALHVAGAR